MNCTNYSDHKEGPLSQMRTVAYSGYTVYNSPSVVLYCHLLAQLCNLENKFYVEITRKLSRDNEKIKSWSRENNKEKNNNAWPLRTSVKTSDFMPLKCNRQRKRTHFAIYARAVWETVSECCTHVKMVLIERGSIEHEVIFATL